jgi:hypothetical protein
MTQRAETKSANAKTVLIAENFTSQCQKLEQNSILRKIKYVVFYGFSNRTLLTLRNYWSLQLLNNWKFGYECVLRIIKMNKNHIREEKIQLF